MLGPPVDAQPQPVGDFCRSLTSGSAGSVFGSSVSGDPGIEYPFLEESSSLEKVVTPSVADVEVVNKKLSWNNSLDIICMLQILVPT